jgi:hypothetical protein
LICLQRTYTNIQQSHEKIFDIIVTKEIQINTTKTTSHPLMAIIKEIRRITSVDEDVEK